MTPWPLWYCPFLDEKRKPEDIHACPMRYRVTCGCRHDQKPSPFRHYRRPSA